jgi:hypothetical protein
MYLIIFFMFQVFYIPSLFARGLGGAGSVDGGRFPEICIRVK